VKERTVLIAWIVVCAATATMLGLAVVGGAAGCASAKMIAQADGCRERGRSILHTGMTCESKAAALARLVREDPSCVAIFGPDAAAPVYCPEGGTP
jgi:hypothetical protein